MIAWRSSSLPRRGVIARNRQRAAAAGNAGAANYSMSPNNMHYSCGPNHVPQTEYRRFW